MIEFIKMDAPDWVRGLLSLYATESGPDWSEIISSDLVSIISQERIDPARWADILKNFKTALLEMGASSARPLPTPDGKAHIASIESARIGKVDEASLIRASRDSTRMGIRCAALASLTLHKGDSPGSLSEAAHATAVAFIWKDAWECSDTIQAEHLCAKRYDMAYSKINSLLISAIKLEASFVEGMAAEKIAA